MSSRVLKKLGLQREVDIPALSNNSDNDDTDVSPVSCGKEKYNKYDLVGIVLFNDTFFTLLKESYRYFLYNLLTFAFRLKLVKR